MTQGLQIPIPSQCEWREESRNYDTVWAVRCIWRSHGPVFKGGASLDLDMDGRAVRLSAVETYRQKLRQLALRDVRMQVIAHRAVTEPIPND